LYAVTTMSPSAIFRCKRFDLTPDYNKGFSRI
jgi:hypothetical protein